MSSSDGRVGGSTHGTGNRTGSLKNRRFRAVPVRFRAVRADPGYFAHPYF